MLHDWRDVVYCCSLLAWEHLWHAFLYGTSECRRDSSAWSLPTTKMHLAALPRTLRKSVRKWLKSESATRFRSNNLSRGSLTPTLHTSWGAQISKHIFFRVLLFTVRKTHVIRLMEYSCMAYVVEVFPKTRASSIDNATCAPTAGLKWSLRKEPRVSSWNFLRITVASTIHISHPATHVDRDYCRPQSDNAWTCITHPFIGFIRRRRPGSPSANFGQTLRMANWKALSK